MSLPLSSGASAVCRHAQIELGLRSDEVGWDIIPLPWLASSSHVGYVWPPLLIIPWPSLDPQVRHWARAMFEMFQLWVEYMSFLVHSNVSCILIALYCFLVLERYDDPGPMAIQMKIMKKANFAFCFWVFLLNMPHTLQMFQALYWVFFPWITSHAHFSSHIKTFKVICSVFHCLMALFSFSYGKYMILGDTSGF